MDPRKLGRLLATLRENGVTSVQFDSKSNPVRIDFGAPPMVVPDGDVEGMEQPDAAWAAGAPMALQQAFDRIRGEYAKKAKGAKA